MRRCPNCGNTELVEDRARVPAPDGEPVTTYTFFCPQCGLYESSSAEDPDLPAFLARWSGRAAPAS